MQDLKMGPFGGSIIEMPVGAAEVFKHRSGCYVVADGSGRIEVAGASSTAILGWALTYEFTASTTEGRTTVGVETDLFKLFKMPVYSASAVTEAILQGCIGETHDIYVSSSVMSCNIDASAVDILLAFGYEFVGATAATNTMIVKINVVKVTGYTTHS